MQDKVETENQESITAVSGEKPQYSHCYYETGNDILSKPRALVDLLVQMGTPTAVIFCNAPSEADLVAAMLRKNGVNCQKLIGHVPASKVEQTNDEIKAGQLKIVVTTDIGATNLKMSAFEYLINYSIHEDPETYINRCSDFEAGSVIKKVISLVSPLDVGNFHYLKKLVEFDFEKAELPTKAEMIEAKLAKLIHEAETSSHLTEEGMGEIVEKIISHGSAKAVVALLMHNTLVALPEALSQVRGRGQQSQEREGEEKYGRNQRRDNRRNDRHQNDHGDSRGHEEQQKGEIRYYLGAGSENISSIDEVKNSLVEKGLDAAAIKRVFLRNSYGFVDIDNEHADKAVEALKEIEIAGSKLYAVKATELPGLRTERTPRNNNPRRHNNSRNDSDEANTSEEEGFEDDLSQVQMLANYDKGHKGQRAKD